MFAIAEDQVAGDTIELKDVIADAMARIDTRVAAKHPLTGASARASSTSTTSPAASRARNS